MSYLGWLFPELNLAPRSSERLAMLMRSTSAPVVRAASPSGLEVLACIAFAIPGIVAWYWLHKFPFRIWIGIELLSALGVMAICMRPVYRAVRAHMRFLLARRQIPVCIDCGYDLRRIGSAQACPECGTSCAQSAFAIELLGRGVSPSLRDMCLLYRSPEDAIAGLHRAEQRLGGEWRNRLLISVGVGFAVFVIMYMFSLGTLRRIVSDEVLRASLVMGSLLSLAAGFGIYRVVLRDLWRMIERDAKEFGLNTETDRVRDSKE